MTAMPAAVPTIARLPTPDLAAIKQRQQATWSSGDYHMIGTQIQVVSELLIEALDVHSTERVLDVATGSGNAALAAARRGVRRHRRRLRPVPARPCPAARRRRGAAGRVRRGRRRGAAVPRRAVRRRELGVRRHVRAGPGADRGRAGPRLPRRAAASASSPTRPTASSGSCSGSSGATSRRRPGCARRSSGAPRRACASCSAAQIGGAARREAASTSSAIARPRRYLDYWRRFYGPTLKAFEAVGEDGREALEQDLLQLIATFNRADDGTMVVPTEYLEAVIVKR